MSYWRLTCNFCISPSDYSDTNHLSSRLPLGDRGIKFSKAFKRRTEVGVLYFTVTCYVVGIRKYRQGSRLNRTYTVVPYKMCHTSGCYFVIHCG